MLLMGEFSIQSIADERVRNGLLDVFGIPENMREFAWVLRNGPDGTPELAASTGAPGCYVVFYGTIK